MMHVNYLQDQVCNLNLFQFYAHQFNMVLHLNSEVGVIFKGDVYLYLEPEAFTQDRGDIGEIHTDTVKIIIRKGVHDIIIMFVEHLFDYIHGVCITNVMQD